MADRVTIPAALLEEIRADLAAGGDRARRWRPDVATRQVLNLHDGDVCDVLAMPRPNGTLPVERAGIALSWLDAWAPVGGVDGGPRPEPGQRLLARRTPMRVHDGHVGICRSARPVIAEFNPEHPAERDLAGSFAVTEWAILPPEIPAEVHVADSALTILTMRMHRDGDGKCWADSAILPGYTAAGRDFAHVMGLVKDAVHGGWRLLGALDPKLVDLRWQWCDDPTRTVAAITSEHPMWRDEPRYACPCMESPDA